MRVRSLFASLGVLSVLLIPASGVAQSYLPFGIGGSVDTNDEETSEMENKGSPSGEASSSSSFLPFGIQREEEPVFEEPVTSKASSSSQKADTSSKKTSRAKTTVTKTVTPAAEVDYSATQSSLARVGKGKSSFITAFGACAEVKNMSSLGDLMVPHRTKLEWDSFLKYAPQSPAISVAGCCSVQELLNCGTGYNVTVPRKYQDLIYVGERDAIELNVPNGVSSKYRCSKNGWVNVDRGKDLCELP